MAQWYGLILLAALSSANLVAIAAELTAPQDLSFTAACDATTQSYILRLPEGFNREVGHDLLIALHGHGTDRWQFATDPRDECRAARDAASTHTMIYVTPDYRATTSWMGPKAESDVVQLIGILKSQFLVERVIICGGSMGGSSSLTFAALHPDLVDGVAAMNGTANHLEYENFQEAIGESFGGAKKAIPLEYKKRSAEYWPERLTMPIGLTISGKDDSVPPASVRRLAGVLHKLNPDVLLIERENEGHLTHYDDAKAILEFVIDRARHRHMRPTKTP